MAITYIGEVAHATGTASAGGEFTVPTEEKFGSNIGRRWIVAVAQAAEAAPTSMEVESAKGGIFVKDGEEHSTTAVNLSIWSSEIKSSGSKNLTIKGLKALAVVEVIISEWEGIQKQENGSYVSTKSAGAKGSGTAVEAGIIEKAPSTTDMIYAAFGATSLGTFSATSPYKGLTGADQTGGSVGAEYNIETTATTAPKATLSLTGTWVGKAVVYKTRSMSLIATLRIGLLQNLQSIRFLTLDTLQRVIEKPLSNGGQWTLINGCKTTGELSEISSHIRWKATTGFAEGEDGAYWNPEEFTEPATSVQIFGISATNSRYFFLESCLSTPTTTEKSGYRLKVEETVESKKENKVTVELMKKGVFTVLAETTGVVIAIEDSIALQVIEGKVIAWHKVGASGAWTIVNQGTDSTYTKGYIGFGAKGNNGRLENFDIAIPHTLARTTTKQLHASLPFAGALRRTAEKLTATLTFSGSLPRNTKYQLPASLSFLGSLARFLTHPLSASLSFAANVTRLVAHSITAKLEFEGHLGRDTLRILAASVSFTGALPRNIVHQLRATLEFAGSLVPKASEFTQKLVASLSFLGTLPRSIVRQESASLGSEGSLGKDTSHAIAGALSFLGTLSPRTRRALTASLSFAGSVASRTTTRALTAALTFVGSVRGTATKQLEATLTFAGTSRRNIRHALSGELSFSGFLKLTGEFIQRFNASLNFAGTLPRSIRHSLAASLTFKGSVGRSIVHALEGSLGATGALQRAILHQLAGSLGVSGETSNKTYHQLTASVTFVGTVGRSVLRELRAALTLAGSMVPQVKLVQVLVATLSFNGRIAGSNIRRALTATLSFFGSINFEKIFGTKPIPDILLRKQSEFPTLTLRRRESGEVYGLVNHLEGFPEMEVQPVVRRRQVFGRKG